MDGFKKVTANARRVFRGGLDWPKSTFDLAVSSTRRAVTSTRL